MKIIRFKIALLVLLVASSSSLMLMGQADVTTMLQEAKKLADAFREEAALEKYNEVLAVEPDNFEALWNASFLYSRIGNRFSSKSSQRSYFDKAEKLAEKAIKVNGNTEEGYFALGVAKGRIALIASAKERVAASSAIKKNAELTIKYNGQHPGGWHLLGRWHTKVAGLSFAEKAAANALFGGLPEGASYVNAVKCYKNAIKYDPDYILFHLDLAKVYIKMKNYTEAGRVLDKIEKMPVITPDDPEYKQEARGLNKLIK